MFWTEIGNTVKIERAGMDGSERRAVVNSSLGWPGGVAVDAIAERVYWADERLGAIGSAALDGNDIRVKQFGEGDDLFGYLCTLTWSNVPPDSPDKRHLEPVFIGSIQWQAVLDWCQKTSGA